MSAARKILPAPRPHSVIQHDYAEDFTVYEPAGFVLRWYAITIDLTFAAPLDLFVHLPFERYLERLNAYGHTTAYHLLGGLLTAIPVLLYFIVPTMIWGQTLGKRIVGVRVITRGGNPRLAPFAVFVRETFGRLLSCVTLGVGFLMAAAEPHKRALHDHISNTDVVSYRVKSVPTTDTPGR